MRSYVRSYSLHAFYTCSVGGEKTETGTHSSVAITQWKIKPTENMINITHTKANNPSVRIGSMILRTVQESWLAKYFAW